MTYFIFNPQTNSLDDSDHPTPIRKNLGEKLLAKKDDNIYPWGYDKNPPWAYIPKDPFDPSIHERFLEDFDIRNETMHADGGRVGFNKGSKKSFGFGRENWRTEKVTLGDKNYR